MVQGRIKFFELVKKILKLKAMGRKKQPKWYVTRKPSSDYQLYDFARTAEQAKNMLRDLEEGSPVAHKSRSEGGNYNIYVKKGSVLWREDGGSADGGSTYKGGGEILEYAGVKYLVGEEKIDVLTNERWALHDIDENGKMTVYNYDADKEKTVSYMDWQNPSKFKTTPKNETIGSFEKGGSTYQGGGEIEDVDYGDYIDLGSKGKKYFKQWDGAKMIVVNSISDLDTSKGSSVYPESFVKIIEKYDEDTYAGGGEMKVYDESGKFSLEYLDYRKQSLEAIRQELKNAKSNRSEYKSKSDYDQYISELKGLIREDEKFLEKHSGSTYAGGGGISERYTKVTFFGGKGAGIKALKVAEIKPSGNIDFTKEQALKHAEKMFKNAHPDMYEEYIEDGRRSSILEWYNKDRFEQWSHSDEKGWTQTDDSAYADMERFEDGGVMSSTYQGGGKAKENTFVVYGEDKDGKYKLISTHKSMKAANAKLDKEWEKGEYDNMGATNSKKWNQFYAPHSYAKGGSTYQDGGEIKEVTDGIFFSNSNKGKISTSFGEKTYDGLKAMIENDSYEPKEIADAIFDSNSRNGIISTSYGSKDVSGLTEMIKIARSSSTYQGGGEIRFSPLSTSQNFDIHTPQGSFEIEVDDDGKPKYAIKHGDDHRFSWERGELKPYREYILDYAQWRHPQFIESSQMSDYLVQMGRGFDENELEQVARDEGYIWSEKRKGWIKTYQGGGSVKGKTCTWYKGALSFLNW